MFCYEITKQDLQKINRGLESLGLVEVDTIDTSREKIELSVKSQNPGVLESDEAKQWSKSLSQMWFIPTSRLIEAMNLFTGLTIQNTEGAVINKLCGERPILKETIFDS